MVPCAIAMAARVSVSWVSAGVKVRLRPSVQRQSHAQALPPGLRIMEGRIECAFAR